jgi:hypothetical protein
MPDQVIRQGFYSRARNDPALIDDAKLTRDAARERKLLFH